MTDAKTIAAGLPTDVAKRVRRLARSLDKTTSMGKREANGLVQRKLAFRALNDSQRVEWGKVVATLAVVTLTPLGEEVAAELALLATGDQA